MRTAGRIDTACSMPVKGTKPHGLKPVPLSETLSFRPAVGGTGFSRCAARSVQRVGGEALEDHLVAGRDVMTCRKAAIHFQHIFRIGIDAARSLRVWLGVRDDAHDAAVG